MIKDKHSVRQPHQPAPVQESLPEEVSENPFVNMYQAVKRAITDHKGGSGRSALTSLFQDYSH